ncbi:MAG: ATP-binding protein [Thermoanaerobaculales bacterium]
MDEPSAGRSRLRSWWLALAAVAVCGPWPGWDPAPWAVGVLVAAFFVLARPKGRGWVAWAAVLVGVIVSVWPADRVADSDRLSRALDVHCRKMLRTAEGIATDPTMVRLLGAGGEALDPALPFSVLEKRVGGAAGRTAYLADDRGQVVAWGGASRYFPHGVRPLGQRRWGISWSAAGADLWVREPLLVDGRLVGAVTISDHSPLSASRIWGMRAPRDHAVALGQNLPGVVSVTAATGSGIVVPVAFAVGSPEAGSLARWLGWSLLALGAIVVAPEVAWAVVALGGGALMVGRGIAPDPAVAVLILLAAAAGGRLASVLPPKWSRALVIIGVATAAGASVFCSPAFRFGWLPDHLLRPGWGGVWMVAMAWLAAGWPGPADEQISLVRRLRAATMLALLGLGVYVVRMPVELARWGADRESVVLPRGQLGLEEVLPVPSEVCRLDDVAPVLAKEWGLDSWRTPTELRMVSQEGAEVSRWGDLSPAGEHVRTLRRWLAGASGGLTVELLVATEPWNWLSDWRTGVALEEAHDGQAWVAVLTRSGKVAATLHPAIRDLDAITAGELFHGGGGWTRLTVGKTRRMARVWLRGQWLVAAVAPHPSTADWVIRTAVAMLWAFLGLLLARPPVIGMEHVMTFGGRLRLLVAGGVVVPLAILTLFMHQRIRSEELRLEQVLGLDALNAAGYTAENLGGSFAVDDELARWLAAGWGGEVTLWDGTFPVAASRRDLMTVGALPQLPASASYPLFLLGRDDPMVFRWQDRVVAAAPINLQGRRLLLHLYRYDPLRSGAAPGAVDWLLTGALLSALLALALTTGVERRLSISLRELVALARKLLDGEPAGPLRRPRETDLAEVLDAVRSMNEEVQQRELSLRHQEELLRITLSTLAPAVVVLDPAGEIRFANPSAQHLEQEHGNLMIAEISRLAGPGWAGETMTGTVQPFPGSDLTWRIGVAGVPFPDGDRGLVAVVDDVTDLVQAGRLRQLNQMARIVAHEVKNPLTPVRLWVQELQDASGRDDPEIRSLLEEACKEIAIQVARLEETANSFSNLVALERWEPEPVDLSELLSEMPSGAGILERRGITVAHEIDAQVPSVMGDRQWLRRALANLVQNSIDALAEEGGKIFLRLSSEGDRVVVEVEDSGGGVPDDRLPDLFAPHFSTTASGSGLGLALVHQVVARCQGRVAASNSDLGLKIRLDFPAVSRLVR